jgi:hypothetical protein
MSIVGREGGNQVGSGEEAKKEEKIEGERLESGGVVYRRRKEKRRGGGKRHRIEGR